MNSLSIVSNISQSTPVIFTGKQIALWSGHTVALLSAIPPAVAIATAVALAVIIGVVVYVYKKYQANLELSLQLLDDKSAQLEGKNVELHNANIEISKLDDEIINLKAAEEAALLKLKMASSELQKFEKEKEAFNVIFDQCKFVNTQIKAQNKTLGVKNNELKEELNQIEDWIKKAHEATIRELQVSQVGSIPLDLGRSLSTSFLAESFVAISSESDDLLEKQKYLIKEGKQFLSTVLVASKENLDILIKDIKENNQTAQKTAMILWALMDIAREKKQAFEEGSFICKDENGHLTELLISLGTERISSHLKDVAEAKHYGIDVVPTNEYFLPEHKRHVLIAAIDKPELGGKRIFIKPENFGITTSADILGHAWEYVHSLGRKMNPAVFGSDDAEDYRKERVPQDLLKKFKDMIDKLGKREQPETEVDPYEKAKKFGVSAMYQFVKERIELNHLSDSIKGEIVEFKETLEKMGEAEVRVGREVIIDNLTDL